MRTKQRQFASRLAIIATMAGPAFAQVTPATPPEAILCSGTYIAVGRVLEAVNADCRASKRDGCAPGSFVDLKVEIAEVMGAREASPSYSVGRDLKPGDIIAIRSRAFTRPEVARTTHRPDGDTVLPGPEGAVLSERQIRDAFLGRPFVLSVLMMAPHVEQPAFRAYLWPLSDKTWALDTLIRERGTNCPRRH